MLTKKEREVVELICDGYSRKEVASILGVKIETIKSHMHFVYNKTGVSNSAELWKVIHLPGFKCKPRIQ